MGPGSAYVVIKLKLTLALFLGSLSDAVGHVTMDDKHEEHRQKLRVMQTAHSTDHIMAGLKGLGLGLYGGLTSIVSQTYTGATQEGLPVSSVLPDFFFVSVMDNCILGINLTLFMVGLEGGTSCLL